MKYLLTIFTLLPILVFSQARIVLNDNGYIRLNGGTQANKVYLVIANGNANAITTNGSGGNIVSEGENNLIKWNIGDKTGNHVVPWTNSGGIKLPLSVNITSAGNNTGNILLSTYRTSNALNNTYPQWPGIPVTHMNSDALGGADASLHAIDRFWKIDASSYTTKPNVTLSFDYNMATEGASPNTFAGGLKAQRWNSDEGTWGGAAKMFGVDNGIRVAAVIPVADFYENWTLVDITTPLPVELTNFAVYCNEDNVNIYWTTASERNSDYFVLEKSRDGITWEQVTITEAAGNSNTVNEYNVYDYSSNLIYFRLIQVDYDGVETIYGPISTDCQISQSDWSIYPVPVSDEATVTIQTNEDFTGDLLVVDNQGKTVLQQTVQLHQGVNLIQLTTQNLAASTYTVYLVNNTTFKPLRFVKM